MIRRNLLTSGGLCAALACVFSLAIGPANAYVDQWQTAINTGTPPTFQAVNFGPLPQTMDIGAVAGDTTYEFLVTGNRVGVSSALMGSLPGGQAIKFNQYNDTGKYGATQFGVADYDFGVPTVFGQPTILDFVANSAANTTTLWVNGVNTGATVPFALSLGGKVGVGASVRASGTFFDALNGQMPGFAVFNRMLTPDEIKAHADAFAAIPEPGSLALLASALPFAGLLRRRKAIR